MSSFSRGPLAAPARTLVDVLAETVGRHPDAPAIDDGTAAFSYRELAGRGRADRGAARRRRRPPRRPGRRPAPVRHRATCTSRSSASCAAGAAYVPVDADDPDERADLVFGEAGVVRPVDRRRTRHRVPTGRPGRPRPAGRTPDAGRRRLDHLHLRLDRRAQGRRRHPPLGGRLRRRRGAAVPAGRPARPRRPGAGRPVGRLRRLLRGDVAGLAPRRLPGAGAPRRWCAPASTSGRGSSSSGITVVSTVPTLAALWPAEALEQRAAADLRRRGLPARARRTGWPTDGREVWNTYGPTEATVVACAALLDETGPVRIGLPLDGWDARRRRPRRRRRSPRARPAS